MAKKEGFKKPIRNRGEDIGTDNLANGAYDLSVNPKERAIRRNEIREVYEQSYHKLQERDQRAFARVRQLENEFYAGLDPRRKQEVAEGGIIREDQTAMANLPLKAQHHEYPRAEYFSSNFLDDTRQGFIKPFGDDNSTEMF